MNKSLMLPNINPLVVVNPRIHEQQQQLQQLQSYEFIFAQNGQKVTTGLINAIFLLKMTKRSS